MTLIYTILMLILILILIPTFTPILNLFWPLFWTSFWPTYSPKYRPLYLHSSRRGCSAVLGTDSSMCFHKIDLFSKLSHNYRDRKQFCIKELYFWKQSFNHQGTVNCKDGFQSCVPFLGFVSGLLCRNQRYLIFKLS